MTENLQALSLYEGFFSGGARILHSNVLLGLQEMGQAHSVLSIHDQVYREDTVQPMENDACYRALTEAGVAISSLGRRFIGQQPDNTSFTDKELEAYRLMACESGLVLSLKEQPLRLARQAGRIGRPIIACLHRSDPENQGSALDHLRHGVTSGDIAACTISAHTAKNAYVAAGIPEGKIHVVTNGIDLTRFQPSAKNRERMRQELDIPPNSSVVAFAARFDGMKDVPLFMRTAKIYLDQEPDGHIIMCGAGMRIQNAALVELLWREIRVDQLKRMHLLGIRHDMEAVYAAADVISSTSAHGETYPLALLEGMSCGAIPVSTDVGDTKFMLDGFGIITTRQPEQIAQAWQHAISRRQDFALTPGDLMRFGHDAMVTSYAEIFDAYAIRPNA
jgi:glycosyltransferase involved in cell wall biosynthesis